MPYFSTRAILPKLIDLMRRRNRIFSINVSKKGKEKKRTIHRIYFGMCLSFCDKCSSHSSLCLNMIVLDGIRVLVHNRTDLKQ